MPPYRSRVPMVPMYPPHMMMPRMPAAMAFRSRWPVYNSGAALKKTQPSTDTSTKTEKPKPVLGPVSDQQDISSSRQDNAIDNTSGEA